MKVVRPIKITNPYLLRTLANSDAFVLFVIDFRVISKMIILHVNQSVADRIG